MSCANSLPNSLNLQWLQHDTLQGLAKAVGELNGTPWQHPRCQPFSREKQPVHTSDLVCQKEPCDSKSPATLYNRDHLPKSRSSSNAKRSRAKYICSSAGSVMRARQYHFLSPTAACTEPEARLQAVRAGEENDYIHEHYRRWLVDLVMRPWSLKSLKESSTHSTYRLLN